MYSLKSTCESWRYVWTTLVKFVLNGISNEISSRQCTTEKCLITSLSFVLYGWVLEVATPRLAIGSGLQWGHLNCLKAESWRTRDIAGQEGPECPVWACKQVLAVIGVRQWAGILLWQGIFRGKASTASLLPLHELHTFFTAVKICCLIDIRMFVRVDIMQWFHQKKNLNLKTLF